MLQLRSPTLTSSHCVHGIVIDDLWIHSLDKDLAARTLARVLAAYRAVGLVAKESKIVHPTSDPVKVIGFEINGRTGSIRLREETQIRLRQDTLALLSRGESSSTLLSHIIGRWTWPMMLRRPLLSVLQHVYR